MKASDIGATTTVLGPGEYKFAHGHRGYVLHGVLHVVPYIPRGVPPEDKRCRDCKNRIEGRNKRGAYYDAWVCKMRPKEVYCGIQLYYRCGELDHICQHFDEKKKCTNQSLQQQTPGKKQH